MAYYKCGSIYTTQNSNVVVDTASGAIANFETPLAMPLIETKFGVKATQEAGTPTPQSPKAISGVNAVSVTHLGKNLFDVNNIRLLEVAVGSRWGYSISKAGTYKASVSYNGSAFLYCVIKAVDGTYGKSIYLQVDTTITPITITVNEGETLIFYNASANQTEEITKQKMANAQIEVGTITTTFEAYNGSTTLINLGGTYYGGYISQDKDGKRELVVTCAKEHISLQGKTYDTANGFDAWLIYLENRSYNAGSSTNKLCSVCNNYRYEGSVANVEHYYISSGAVVIYLLENTFRNGEFDVVYPLETPFTVALPDGEPIKSFPGVNNIFCDTGDTSLQFRKIG